ncbi:hypothetical protein [Dyadobacter sp. CY312]|uniref:hypothetical protein n=1 Tax=Dyadobacter sp. CY312 TaxID=2907303 RepID=UPI001F182B67|nr:hypothetical protein [Dyadobacter sp. CY312]MCE7043810.1 hypothetical protein [Dyadobacter sp. CY312]
MRISLFLFVMFIAALSCNKYDNLKDISVSPRIFKEKDTLFLEWNFVNNTKNNLIIPTLLTFRRLNGEDDKKYLFKEDYDIIGLPKESIRTIKVPYKYLRQIPNISMDMDIHKKIQYLGKDTLSDYSLDRTFDYIENLRLCPEFIVINAKSEKKILFMFQSGIYGQYSLGFESKYETDATSTIRAGDSIWKKGIPRLKDIVSGRINGYKFEYGEFTVDSINVKLEGNY